MSILSPLAAEEWLGKAEVDKLCKENRNPLKRVFVFSAARLSVAEECAEECGHILLLDRKGLVQRKKVLYKCPFL